MKPCVVRYPIRLLIISGVPLVVALIGLAMALQHKGGWSFRGALLWAAFGIFALLYHGLYKTVFGSESVQQYGFLRPVRDYPYRSIREIQIGEGKGINTIVLTLSGGKRVTVYGADPQLLAAKEVLKLKLPHLVEDEDDLSDAELAELRDYAEERIRLWRTRVWLAAVTFGVSCVILYPFLKGNSLHAYWDAFGKYLVFVCMFLFFLLVFCVLYFWITRQAWHNTIKENSPH